MARQIIIDLVQADTWPAISFRFDGLDLSDYTTLVFNVVRDDNTKISKTVTPDGTDAEVGTIQFATGDLIVGKHEGEFKFTTSGGYDLRIPRKYPVLLNVRANKD